MKAVKRLPLYYLTFCFPHSYCSISKQFATHSQPSNILKTLLFSTLLYFPFYIFYFSLLLPLFLSNFPTTTFLAVHTGWCKPHYFETFLFSNSKELLYFVIVKPKFRIFLQISWTLKLGFVIQRCGSEQLLIRLIRLCVLILTWICGKKLKTGERNRHVTRKLYTGNNLTGQFDVFTVQLMPSFYILCSD